jgi:hypothetical protein
MKRLPIDEADASQLQAFATVHLGLELGGRENRPTLRSKIAEAGWDKDFIVVEEASAGASVPTGSGHYTNTRPSDKHPGEVDVKIMVHTSTAADGEQPVFVSVNGSAMLIPRGEPSWVPQRYVEVLEHAVEQVYDASPDGGRGGLPAPRAVPSYPFSYV